MLRMWMDRNIKSIRYINIYFISKICYLFSYIWQVKKVSVFKHTSKQSKDGDFMKKNIILTSILVVMILGVCASMFTKETKMQKSREDTYNATTKRVLLDTQTIEKWVMPEQNRDGYAAKQEGFSVYYRVNGGKTIKFPVSLAYGTVYVPMPQGKTSNPAAKSGILYEMELPANGINYVTLMKNTVEVRQYGVYERTDNLPVSWELVEIEEETELLDQIFRRVEVDNLHYYDYTESTLL